MMLTTLAVVGFGWVPTCAAQPDPVTELLTDCRAALSGNDGVLRFVRKDGDWQLISIDASHCENVVLEPIFYCSSIESLDIRADYEENENSTRSGIATISRFTNLRKLTINAKDLVDAFELRSTQFPSIEYLQLVGEKDDVDIVLSHLGAFPRLKGLGVDANLTDDSLTHVHEAPGLEVLQIIGATITDDALAKISELHELQSLELPWCYDLTAEGVRKLTSLSKLRQVSLELVDREMISELERLSALETLTCCFRKREADLRSLKSLRTWKIAPIGQIENPPLMVFIPQSVYEVRSQYEYLPNFDSDGQNVERVYIESYYGWDKPVATWARDLPRLTHLTIDAAKDADVQDIVEMKNLRSLALIGPCTAIWPDKLSELKALRSLEKLVLEVSGHDFDFSFIESLESLERLSIPWVDLNESDLESISKLKKLRAITLGFSNTNEEFERGIEKLASLQNLDELTYSGSINAEQLKCLSTLKSLRRLNISWGQPDSDDELAKLMMETSNLTEVLLNGPCDYREDGRSEDD